MTSDRSVIVCTSSPVAALFRQYPRTGHFGADGVRSLRSMPGHVGLGPGDPDAREQASAATRAPSALAWIQESTAEVSSAAGKSPFTNRRAISMLRSDHHFSRDEKYSAAYPSINDGSVPERNPAIVASRRSFESEPSVVADAQAAALGLGIGNRRHSADVRRSTR